MKKNFNHWTTSQHFTSPKSLQRHLWINMLMKESLKDISPLPFTTKTNTLSLKHSKQQEMKRRTNSPLSPRRTRRSAKMIRTIYFWTRSKKLSGAGWFTPKTMVGTSIWRKILVRVRSESYWRMLKNTSTNRIRDGCWFRKTWKLDSRMNIFSSSTTDKRSDIC